MEAFTFVMALMGCGDGGGACAEVRLSDYSFRDRAQCERAVEAVLTTSTDIGYPTIAARCMSVRQYSASRDGTTVRAALANLQRFDQ